MTTRKAKCQVYSHFLFARFRRARPIVGQQLRPCRPDQVLRGAPAQPGLLFRTTR